MEPLKEKYWQKLIESIRHGTAIDFPLDSSILQIEPGLDRYINITIELKGEYFKIKVLYENDPASYIKFILNRLKNFRDNRKEVQYEIFKHFFIALDYPLLSQSHKARFDEAINFFEESIDYFCSYTSKGLPEINNTYEQLIGKIFGLNKATDTQLLRQTNYVAKSIVRYFNEHGFNYFFDLDKIVNGDEIETKVFAYCQRAIVLVILAQQETFRDQKGQRNWCFEEYEHYTSTHRDKKQFLVYKIPTISKPLGARDDIKNWFDYISTSEGIRGETIDFAWSNDMLQAQINKDAQVILDAKNRSFSALLFSIN